MSRICIACLSSQIEIGNSSLIRVPNKWARFFYADARNASPHLFFFLCSMSSVLPLRFLALRRAADFMRAELVPIARLGVSVGRLAII